MLLSLFCHLCMEQECPQSIPQSWKSEDWPVVFSIHDPIENGRIKQPKSTACFSIARLMINMQGQGCHSKLWIHKDVTGKDRKSFVSLFIYMSLSCEEQVPPREWSRENKHTKSLIISLSLRNVFSFWIMPYSIKNMNES